MRKPEKTTDAAPAVCHACRYETTDLASYKNRGTGSPDKNPMWLCELCARGVGGDTVEYPVMCADIMAVQAVFYVGNVLLAALKERPRRERRAGGRG